MEKKAMIYLKEDEVNKGKEQYKFYQLDGRTLQVPVGKMIQVPVWVAELAKAAGDIDDFQLI